MLSPASIALAVALAGLLVSLFLYLRYLRHPRSLMDLREFGAFHPQLKGLYRKAALPVYDAILGGFSDAWEGADPGVRDMYVDAAVQKVGQNAESARQFTSSMSAQLLAAGASTPAAALVAEAVLPPPPPPAPPAPKAAASRAPPKPPALAWPWYYYYPPSQGRATYVLPAGAYP